MISNNVAPYVLAMIVCDEAWRDPNTGKLTLLGIFNTVMADEFPFQLPQIVVYFTLTDGRGRFVISVRFVAVGEEDEGISETSAVIAFADPRALHEGEVRLVGAVLPRPGEYRFQLLAGEDLLLERRIEVRVPWSEA